MGVTKEITRPGPAGAQVPAKGDTIVIHYHGTLSDGTKFDSSVERGTPFETPIGVGRVIKGWDEGILGSKESGIAPMRVGEKAKLTITHDYAYGERGFPPVIPPKATLIFEVELIGIKGKQEL
ncbi:FK506-binding protein 1A [Orbilia oligospora]|uniref:peptidylprolyl isomerase n=1 Tax=Orbilia oligospora TaxID=2813651 RepID=A0A7C8J234_ORBOL|nr:FK506-binding protein 1A [Orbilia oligospora]KAF3087323.1 FK506-binding protein 1A [Orbilia oligospora]KAF3103634.1 FK506-binding protein 1A [Orbilia oligospora]KAF3142614.1 FK506-binding protein 1A [Orbilia oligospora]KAF3157463.1 FK506-binding protein 1A [Orbilia oligospora]